MKQNIRQRLVWRLVWKSMMVLCSLSMALLWPALANAIDTCPPICGEVDNFSSWTMHFTTTLGLPDGEDQGDHLCDVWNWEGGSAEVWQQAECQQEELVEDGHAGGGGVDVDAFTISTRDYMLSFHGTWSWQTKGVWTKIENWEGAWCKTYWEFYVPMCFVEYQP